MKQITIELSNPASAVINAMATRGKVTPEAIAKVALEHTLSQAIDDSIAEDGDLWFRECAPDPETTCRECWKDVKKPERYAITLALA
jgi:hypothetical protein